VKLAFQQGKNQISIIHFVLQGNFAGKRIFVHFLEKNGSFWRILVFSYVLKYQGKLGLAEV